MFCLAPPQRTCQAWVDHKAPASIAPGIIRACKPPCRDRRMHQGWILSFDQTIFSGPLNDHNVVLAFCCKCNIYHVIYLQNGGLQSKPTATAKCFHCFSFMKLFSVSQKLNWSNHNEQDDWRRFIQFTKRLLFGH